MRLRFFIAALLLVFVAGAANAQEYIEGKVVDASSLEGIGNVFIKNVTK